MVPQAKGADDLHAKFRPVEFDKDVLRRVGVGWLAGVGISLAANKVRGIRAVVCSEPYSAKLSKQHNNTNVLCFGARVIGIELAKMIIDAWLGAEFEGGRHATRVGMIMDIENEKFEG